MKNYLNQGSTTALLNALTAVAMFSLAAFMPELALAQSSTDFKGLTNNAVTQSNGILQIVQVGCYIGGTIMGVSTLMDAKKYSENPASNGPLGKVIGKGAVSAGLLSAPTILANIQNSLVGTGQQQVTPQTFQKVQPGA